MNSKTRIKAKAKLNDEVSVISDDGLAVSPLRVELAEIKRPGEAWIAELNVLGDLPWRKGEKRLVEIRIMSDDFRDYVVLKSPSLLIKRSNEVIGNLEIER